MFIKELLLQFRMLLPAWLVLVCSPADKTSAIGFVALVCARHSSEHNH